MLIAQERLFLWDAISKEKSEFPDAWHLSVDHLDTPETRLAEKLLKPLPTGYTTEKCFQQKNASCVPVTL